MDRRRELSKESLAFEYKLGFDGRGMPFGFPALPTSPFAFLVCDKSVGSARVPINRLVCSTTSTLSAGSTGSQARLIQSSHAPETFQPMQTEELGKSNNKTVKAEIHTPKTTKSPNRSPKRQDQDARRPAPNKNTKRSDSVSPKNSRKSSPRTHRRSRDNSPKPTENNAKSPKKIKSSLKQSSRSLSIENPTCVECYLSGKIDKG